MTDAKIEDYAFVDMTTLTTPSQGLYYVRIDYWWPVTERGQLIFYVKYARGRSARWRYSSPQCNRNRAIAERVAETYPFPVDLMQLPVVYVPCDA